MWKRPSLPLRRHPDESGLALVAVLMLVSLLSVLAVGVLATVRRHSELVQRSGEVIQLQEVADSALRLRFLELSAPGGGGSWLGTQSVDLFGFSTVVATELEAGRVDLNNADHDVLTALLAGNGFSAEDAATAADHIIDWRDPDDMPRTRGAERPEYQRARRLGPRNESFRSVSEVRSVLGLEKISEELIGSFTVYTHLAMPRESAAPPAVQRGLQWANARKLGGREWLSSESGSGSSNRGVIGDLLRLTACVSSKKTAFCRIAVVRITGNASAPVQVFSWETRTEAANLSAPKQD